MVLHYSVHLVLTELLPQDALHTNQKWNSNISDLNCILWFITWILLCFIILHFIIFSKMDPACSSSSFPNQTDYNTFDNTEYSLWDYQYEVPPTSSFNEADNNGPLFDMHLDSLWDFEQDLRQLFGTMDTTPLGMPVVDTHSIAVASVVPVEENSNLVANIVAEAENTIVATDVVAVTENTITAIDVVALTENTIAATDVVARRERTFETNNKQKNKMKRTYLYPTTISKEMLSCLLSSAHNSSCQ